MSFISTWLEKEKAELEAFILGVLEKYGLYSPPPVTPPAPPPGPEKPPTP
jgi:hypothetical protein